MLCIKNLSTLELGRQGENISKTIQIDISNWFDEYGSDIDVVLLAQRPTENEGYFPNVSVENGILSWLITNVDTSFAGYGHAEIIGTNQNGLLVKSKTFKTLIYDSLETGDPPVVPPPAPSWVDTLLDLAEHIEEYMQEVEQDLEEVQEDLVIIHNDIEIIQGDIEYIETFVEDIDEIKEELNNAVYSSQSEEDIQIIYCGSASELVTNPS